MNKMQHITVVTFSPTGGTRRACLGLAFKMGEKVKDVDLGSLKEEYAFGPEDTVVVGVPVFGGRIPAFAAEKLTYLKGNGAVAVTAAVYGNRAFEDALLELDDILQAQGFKIAAGSALLAEHSMVRDIAAGRPDREDEKDTAEFAEEILVKLEKEDWEEPEVPGNRPYRQWNQMPVVPQTDSSCISCGLCAARCPLEAIPVSNPSTTDPGRCILCMRCISVCPVKARSLPEQAKAMLEQKLSPVRDIRRENELFL